MSVREQECIAGSLTGLIGALAPYAPIRKEAHYGGPPLPCITPVATELGACNGRHAHRAAVAEATGCRPSSIMVQGHQPGEGPTGEGPSYARDCRPVDPHSVGAC